MENDDDWVYLITKRELLRRHRAQPTLVESLLLAHRIDERSKHRCKDLSMDFILDLCRFSQKMKWLCPWGPEVVDEINRPPSSEEALRIKVESRGSLTARCWENFLPCSQILSLLQDAEEKWDRISLGMYDPRFFALLHLHPLDELRLDFYDHKLSSDDIQNICKCKHLKFIQTGAERVFFKTIARLQRLPHLQILCKPHRGSQMTYFRNRICAPRDATIHLSDCSSTDSYTVIAYINAHRTFARQILLWDRVDLEISQALAKCTSVKSIIVKDVGLVTNNNLHALFASPKIQKTLQSILNVGDRGDMELAALQACTSLRWLEFVLMDISAETICAIIQANAQHMCSVLIYCCYNVGDAVLEAIAGCRSLHLVNLVETGVTPEAVASYKAHMRPNWQVLNYTERVHSQQ